MNPSAASLSGDTTSSSTGSFLISTIFQVWRSGLFISRPGPLVMIAPFVFADHPLRYLALFSAVARSTSRASALSPSMIATHCPGWRHFLITSQLFVTENHWVRTRLLISACAFAEIHEASGIPGQSLGRRRSHQPSGREQGEDLLPEFWSRACREAC